MSEIKYRILEFLKYLNVGQTKFEETVGLSRGSINNIKGGISSKTLNKISDKYPVLNTSWLLTGEGAMLKQTAETEQHADISNTFADTSNPDNKKTMEMLNKMLSVIDRQSSHIEALLGQNGILLTEIQKGGDRADRMISLIEQMNGVYYTPKKEAI